MEDGNPNTNPMEGGEGGVMRNPNEYYMPTSNIQKIMRRVLPQHARVADDAKEMMQESVTEFISYVTAEANARSHRECRKTVTAEDVLASMSALGFHDYVGPLTVYLNNYRAQDPLRRRAAPAVALPPPMDRRFMGGGAGEGSSSAGAEFGP